MVNDFKKQVEFHTEFKKWYIKILKEFDFDYQKDCKGRDVLSDILIRKSDKWRLENVIISFKEFIEANSNILIYGCGPTLEDTVEKILNVKGLGFFKKVINIAADGASILLEEKSIPINAIFTDLDGITKKEFSLPEYMIIHAHGDNLEKLNYFKREIIEFQNIIGTTQVEPVENVINPGGFTDGDRILYFLRSFLLPKHRLFLIGMDFQNIIGRYSKPEIKEPQEANPIKKKKLQIAVELIKWLQNILKNEIIFVNSESVSKNFSYISIKEFLEKIG